MGGFVLAIGSGLGEFPGELRVLRAENAGAVDFPECVVVMGEGAELPQIIRAAGVVINGDSGGCFPVERLNGVQLITCGRCGKNTVSITSDSGEVLTVALNRAVRTLNGICEPMEIPVVRCDGATDQSCMAGFAAAVLLGMLG